MIALIQRVSRAEVRVGGEVVGAIDAGILALIGVRCADTDAAAERLLERVLSYRIFPDADGRMNRSLREVGGGLLLVPQFTLAADTSRGIGALRLPPQLLEQAPRLLRGAGQAEPGPGALVRVGGQGDERPEGAAARP